MRLTILLPAGILASTVLMNAQATSQQPPPAPPTTAPQPSGQSASISAEPQAKQTTMTGCLKPGTSADAYLLTDAGMAAPASGAAPAPQGTTGSTKSYAVMAKPGTDLSKHVNHKIEVTGTVSASKSSTAPASATPSVGAGAQPTETFNVESFKMVAMACP